MSTPLLWFVIYSHSKAIIPFFTRWSSQKQHRHSLCCAHMFAEGSMCSDPNTLSTIPSTHPPSRLGVHTHGLFLPHSSPTFRSHISLFSLPYSSQWDQQGTRTTMWSSWKKSITYVAIWTNNPAVNNKERAQKWYYIYTAGLAYPTDLVSTRLQLIKLFIPILVVSIFLLKDHVFLCGLAKKFPEPLQ